MNINDYNLSYMFQVWFQRISIKQRVETAVIDNLNNIELH